MALRRQPPQDDKQDEARKLATDARTRYDDGQDEVRAAIAKDDAKRVALTAAKRKALAAEWEASGYGVRLSEPSEEADGFPFIEIDLFDGGGKLCDFGDRLEFGPPYPIGDTALAAAALAIANRPDWEMRCRLTGTWLDGDKERFALACSRVGVTVEGYASPAAKAAADAEKAAKDAIRREAKAYVMARDRALGNSMTGEAPEGIRAYVDGSDDTQRRALLAVDGDPVAAAAFARKAEQRGDRILKANPAASAAVRGTTAAPDHASGGGK